MLLVIWFKGWHFIWVDHLLVLGKCWPLLQRNYTCQLFHYLQWNLQTNTTFFEEWTSANSWILRNPTWWAHRGCSCCLRSERLASKVFRHLRYWNFGGEGHSEYDESCGGTWAEDTKVMFPVSQQACKGGPRGHYASICLILHLLGLQLPRLSFPHQEGSSDAIYYFRVKNDWDYQNGLVENYLTRTDRRTDGQELRTPSLYQKNTYNSILSLASKT